MIVPPAQKKEEQREVEESATAAEDTAQQGFDWTRQWYPVAVMRDLEAMDPRKPYPVKARGEGV